MAITARLDGEPQSEVHEGVGEFLRCVLVYEDGGAEVDRHEHLIPLHERQWTEAEISRVLGMVTQKRIEGLNMVSAQSLDLSQITVG